MGSEELNRVCGSDFTPVSVNSQRACWVAFVPLNAVSMNQSQEYETYIELAIDIFKTQDCKAIAFLKNFLYVLPSPSAIETVLLVALYRLADIEPETGRFLARHPHWFMPELDLASFAMQLALSQLQANHFAQEKDFYATERGLWLSPRAKAALVQENTPGIFLLLEEVLQINN